MDKKFKILTYGCQMNIAESERMAGQLSKIGYTMTEDIEAADLILINSCCVRSTAEDKIYGKIGELKKYKLQNPALIIGVMGCLAQKDGENLIKRSLHIDFVLGTARRGELPKIVESFESARKKFVDTSNVSGIVEDEIFPIRAGKVSAFVPIMYGCNNFCTYCIVPYVRGRERSRPAAEIFAEIKNAVDNGYKEINLLGQNVNSYGKDLGQENFAQLLSAVDKIDGIERLRFMTSHPKDLSDELISVMASGKNICEHIHLPVQYGSNKILKKMNRVYTVEKYLELVKKIRAAIPNISLTTDLIVGFPGETEEDFKLTLNFLREVRFDTAFTFIYSERSGTPAANFEGKVDDETKHRRLNELMTVQNKISLEKNLQFDGATVEVLVEGESKTDKNIYTGRTRSNKAVLFPHESENVGDLINVKINQVQTWIFKGVRAD
ncbi:MAG: tRNA (N6-isopentenyl adenosine(37)-C2)-methylthiotransferase MiaB [Selenomonadaceae bacterium]|nr:tRNA (N6-isopentenyl adenosine(37)-C2)-methylthiotransferase MiaB [Selenomonadaceae bacterium]